MNRTLPPRRAFLPASLPSGAVRSIAPRLAVLALSLLLAGCPGPEAEARLVNDRDTMTQRQRDSVTSTLPIPGSRGVGRALDAADRANARAEQHDALLGGNRE
jgi:hypothetical protein